MRAPRYPLPGTRPATAARSQCGPSVTGSNRRQGRPAPAWLLVPRACRDPRLLQWRVAAVAWARECDPACSCGPNGWGGLAKNAPCPRSLNVSNGSVCWSVLEQNWLRLAEGPRSKSGWPRRSRRQGYHDQAAHSRCASPTMWTEAKSHPADIAQLCLAMPWAIGHGRPIGAQVEGLRGSLNESVPPQVEAGGALQVDSAREEHGASIGCRTRRGNMGRAATALSSIALCSHMLREALLISSAGATYPRRRRPRRTGSPFGRRAGEPLGRVRQHSPAVFRENGRGDVLCVASVGGRVVHLGCHRNLTALPGPGAPKSGCEGPPAQATARRRAPRSV